MKIVRLSAEERAIVTRLSLEQLQFLTDLGENPKFHLLVEIIDNLIDHEKNIFFSEREIEPGKLAVLHSFSRGGIAKLAMLVHIIGAARVELTSRRKD